MDWSLLLTGLAGVLFKLLYFIVVLSTIIVVILDNRNPLKTIAWLLVLIFIPFFGLIIYFFFGQDQRRERIINKKSYSSLLQKPRAQYLAQEDIVLPERYKSLISLFKRTNQAFPYEGN
ncbi:MAG: PLDc N-terminal domain-containing protein, partial [Bacteroides sp.]